MANLGRLGSRLLATLAGKLGFVAGSQLGSLCDAYRELLDATARSAWVTGTQDSAHAIHRALEREHNRVASQAARAILHLHPDVGADAGSTHTIEEAARNVELLLRELGLQHLTPSDRRDPVSHVATDLLVRPRADDALLATMVRQARWFILSHGRGLSDAEVNERLASPTDS